MKVRKTIYFSQFIDKNFICDNKPEPLRYRHIAKNPTFARETGQTFDTFGVTTKKSARHDQANLPIALFLVKNTKSHILVHGISKAQFNDNLERRNYGHLGGFSVL